MAFNALHTGLEALINVVLATSPCAEINVTFSPPYTIVGDKLEQAAWKATCVKPITGTSISGCFSPPSTREDGSALTIEEIDHYEFKDMSMRVCDTQGQCSQWS